MPRVLLGTWSNEKLQHRSKAEPEPIFIGESGVAFNGRLIWKWKGQKFMVLAALIVRAGQTISHEELWCHLWGDREDGGPEYVRNNISVRLTQLRPILAKLGLVLRNIHGRGYEICAEGTDVEHVVLEKGEVK